MRLICKDHLTVKSKIIFILTFCFTITANADCASESKTTAEAIKCLEGKINSTNSISQNHQHNFNVFPKGIVAAFRRVDCPSGWENFNGANGRVIVGTGQAPGTSTKSLEQTGGREKIRLTTAQMPRHQHNTPQAMDNTGPNFGLGPRRLSVHGASWHDNHTELTSFVGDGAEIDISPPFIALKYCIKN